MGFSGPERQNCHRSFSARKSKCIKSGQGLSLSLSRPERLPVFGTLPIVLGHPRQGEEQTTILPFFASREQSPWGLECKSDKSNSAARVSLRHRYNLRNRGLPQTQSAPFLESATRWRKSDSGTILVSRNWLLGMLPTNSINSRPLMNRLKGWLPRECAG